MNTQYIYPALSLIGLTFLVLFRITRTRFPEMRIKKIHPQMVSTRKEMTSLLSDSRASDNLMNLFELPVLFYFMSLLVIFFKLESVIILILMWGFVIARYFHSYIHCTYNKVLHRFYAFFASVFCLIGLFLMIIFKLIF